MKFSKTFLVLCCGMSLGISMQTSSAGLSVQEAEQRRNSIMNSEASFEDKINKLNQLKKLIELNQEVEALLTPPEDSTPIEVAIEKKIENVKQEIKQSALQNQQKNRIKKMKELVRMNDTGIYMSYFYRVGHNVNANFIVNGQERQRVDVNKAISEKTRFGDYIITSVKDRTIQVKNVRSGEKQNLILRSSTEIKNQIAYEQDLTRKYAEAVLMGELDVDLGNLAEKSKTNTLNRAPLNVSYDTISSNPPSFDSHQ